MFIQRSDRVKFVGPFDLGVTNVRELVAIDVSTVCYTADAEEQQKNRRQSNYESEYERIAALEERVHFYDIYGQDCRIIYRISTV